MESYQCAYWYLSLSYRTVPRVNQATHEARCSTGRTKASIQVCDFCGETYSAADAHQSECRVLNSILSRQVSMVTCQVCGETMSVEQMSEHEILHMFERRVSGEFTDMNALKGSTMKARGLNLAQIQAELPVFTPSSKCLTEDCVICMSRFQTSDYVRLLPCCHKFHVSCIDTWLAKSVSCPVCKNDI